MPPGPGGQNENIKKLKIYTPEMINLSLPMSRRHFGYTEGWAEEQQKSFKKMIKKNNLDFIWRGTVQQMSILQPLYQQPILNCGV